MLVRTKGAVDIAAECDVVWNALHDAERLGHCVPGCRSIARRDDGSYALEARVRLGPVRVAFDGIVAIEDCEAPALLSLTGRGRGGRAGEASGTALIRLSERSGGCRLAYQIEARAEGPIALLGPTMLTGIATGLVELFTRRFAKLAETPVAHPRRRSNASSRLTISRSA